MSFGVPISVTIKVLNEVHYSFSSNLSSRKKYSEFKHIYLHAIWIKKKKEIKEKEKKK